MPASSTTPEPEQPFKEGDLCILKESLSVQLVDIKAYCGVNTQQVLPAGSTVTIRDHPIFALLTGHPEMHGAGKARYRIYGEMVLEVYIPVPHTQIIPNTEKALRHGNLEPIWPKTYIVGSPFNAGMIVRVKKDEFHRNKIDKVKAKTLFCLTSLGPISSCARVGVQYLMTLG
ncbi:hypothetical protein C0991_003782 [Blastosporella zonata]|nr:hypothetical protein C0991_003782 [Blastosporella zonata]